MIINKTININAPASRVWEALTTPAIMKRWMTDAEMDITSDWRTGSAIVISGNLHGIPYENKGTILRFEPYSVLKYNCWSSLSQHDDVPENYSLITFRLMASEGITTLVFTQTNFTEDVIFKHFNFYWNTALQLLRRLSEGEALPY
ncbi:MAG: SRPBCC family protein [Pseudobacter sp.]|uniref:SRPBCC family protein n=1 Tax=Pseudobacter sp. TaxID=2045420 RepID=UPI003F823FB6